MRLIYRRAGHVAKSRFDLSLLKPVEENNSSFESQLKPIDENEEDAGAYLDNLPQPEGFLHKLPRNIAIGLEKLSHHIINSPYDMAYGVGSTVTNKLKEFSNAIEKGSPKIFPKYKNLNFPDYAPPINPKIDKDFASMVGQKGEPTLMDSIIQGGIDWTPEILTGRALLRGGFRRLIGTHQLEAVQRAVSQKGLQNFSYPNQMIKDSEKFLPATKATKELIGEVKAGKYGPAFDLQSQVGHHQRKLLKSPLASENSIMAPKAGELKQQMLGHLESVLRKANHIEEADMLRKGISNYRQYKKVMNVAMPIIKYAGIPTTILTALGFAYNKGKKALSD